MDDLIIASLQGLATPGEEERLRRWRADSPRNEKRYHELSEIWSAVASADPIRKHAIGEAPDLWTLLQEADDDESFLPTMGSQPSAVDGPGSVTSIASAATAVAPVDPRKVWMKRLVVGACAASLVGLGLFGVNSIPDRSASYAVLPSTEIVTGAGEVATVTLDDGSTVRVGPRSRIRFFQEQGDQVAWLEGRAFFGVSADPSRAFRVRTHHGEAVVLGTRFEVRAEDEFRVLVVEGSVRVVTAMEEAEVREGEMSRTNELGVVSKVRVAALEPHLDWMGSVLVFQDTPLHRALREVARAYDIEVTLENQAFSDLLVTASFTDRELPEVLVTLCEILAMGCVLSHGSARVGVVGVEAGLRIYQ